MDTHYKKISDKYGLEVQAPENLINNLGYYYLQNNNFDTAIIVFKTNIERYPESANVYDSLGEAYEKNNQPELAKQNYTIAVEHGEKLNDPNLPIYKKNLQRVMDL